MIISASISGKKVVMKDISAPNIYPIDSVSLIAGRPASGKTAYLLDIASGVLGKEPIHSKADFVFGEGFDQDSLKVHYATSSKHNDIPEWPGFQDDKVFSVAELKVVLAPYFEVLVALDFDLSEEKSKLNTSQKIILNLFASLECSFKSMDGKGNALVLLDSVDAGLHPTYQASLIWYLTDFLAECKRQNGVRAVQVVIASDSPLVAGDFPKDFVCRLAPDYWVPGYKDDAKEAGGLGATIQQIYNLVLGCGTIPQFAIRTVNKTIANLKEGKCSEHDDYIISVTGDNLIKRELIRMKDEIR